MVTVYSPVSGGNSHPRLTRSARTAMTPHILGTFARLARRKSNCWSVERWVPTDLRQYPLHQLLNEGCSIDTRRSRHRKCEVCSEAHASCRTLPVEA